MDDRRIGLVVRALRRRRGWRQLDLAQAAGLAQTTVSLIERGHLDSLGLRSFRRVLAALDAQTSLEVRWRGGLLDRLIDERHAALVGATAEILRRCGWEFAVEVTYAHYGERGSIDILAHHSPSRSVLVIEVKSELTSIEETLRRLDAKVRLAPAIARERCGWMAATTSRLLVLAESSANRARLGRHAAVLDAVLPAPAREVRRWLLEPLGAFAGRCLLRLSNRDAATRAAVGPHRVRRRRAAAA